MNLYNQENQFEIKEDSTYPSSTKIIYKEFTIIKQKNFNILSKRPFQEYKIPNKYTVITEWGCGTKHRIIYCQIDYIDNIPQFLIQYRVNFENIVISTKSTSQAALLYKKAIKPSSKIQEVINAIGTGVQYIAKEILLYIITKLMHKNVLQLSDPIIHFQISGDGRNVECKIKQVIVTMIILNDRLYNYHPDYYYTIVLYPDTEKYETLHFALSLFLDELRVFKNEELMCANIH
ncbi:32145_t:CDS:2 [Gigaspora margarita]|uniref:32145_t:CDS:1 n=1 Tax=Gigaspora margarita TaxID=4874 RepID=A0ABN7WPP3_GIGMA|nr:32145_t:CDS:2 [Gigaspora margarita]